MKLKRARRYNGGTAGNKPEKNSSLVEESGVGVRESQHPTNYLQSAPRGSNAQFTRGAVATGL